VPGPPTTTTGARATPAPTFPSYVLCPHNGPHLTNGPTQRPSEVLSFALERIENIRYRLINVTQDIARLQVLLDFLSDTTVDKVD